jgi:hypothetical protein
MKEIPNKALHWAGFLLCFTSARVQGAIKNTLHALSVP